MNLKESKSQLIKTNCSQALFYGYFSFMFTPWHQSFWWFWVGTCHGKKDAASRYETRSPHMLHRLGRSTAWNLGVASESNSLDGTWRTSFTWSAYDMMNWDCTQSIPISTSEKLFVNRKYPGAGSDPSEETEVSSLLRSRCWFRTRYSTTRELFHSGRGETWWQT